MALRGMLVENADKTESNNSLASEYETEDSELSNPEMNRYKSDFTVNRSSAKFEDIDRGLEIRCPKCGEYIAQGSRFCPSCGERVSSDFDRTYESKSVLPSVNHESMSKMTPRKDVNHADSWGKGVSGDKKVHCPNCGCNELSIISETITSNVTTGGGYSGSKGCAGFLLFGPLGLLCGSCGNKSKTTTTNTNINYFICNGCGKKFRVPEDLRLEAEQSEKSINICKIVAIVCAAAALFLSIVDMSITRGELTWAVILGWIDAAVFGILTITTRNKADQLKREYLDLVSKCMDNN